MIPLAPLVCHRMYCWKVFVTDQSVKLISQALTLRARCQRCQNTMMMQQAENGSDGTVGGKLDAMCRIGLSFGVVAFWSDQETFSCIEFACCACLLIFASAYLPRFASLKWIFDDFQAGEWSSAARSQWHSARTQYFMVS